MTTATFDALLCLGSTTQTIFRVGLPDGDVSTVMTATGPVPDGIVVEGDRLFWTTMGEPRVDPDKTGEQALDFHAENGGIHAGARDGSDARELVPAGSITTPKQLASDGRGHLYWCDREGCRVSRVSVDGGTPEDLVVNPGNDVEDWCVGIAVDPAADKLYWSQKGPSKGGRGRIFRTGLTGERTDVELLWEGLPEPIDLELFDGFLYWTDRGAPPNGNTLNRAPIPAPGERGQAPEILMSGLHEAIGLAIDPAARVAYAADLAGDVYAVPVDGGTGRVVARLGQPLTGIAGVGA